MTLVDIVDLKKINQYSNIIFNLAYYNFILNLIKNNKLDFFINVILNKYPIKYKNFSYYISVGPIITAEVKIEGSDNRVETLRKDMADEFIYSSQYSQYYLKAKSKLKSNALKQKRLIEYSKLSSALQKGYKDIYHKNKLINVNFKLPEFYYDIDTSEIENIEYDVLLFISNGCYKYINYFINERNINKLMFWEIHIVQTKAGCYKLYDKNLKDKKVLVIDSIYSGKTMLKVKKEIIKFGGIPILVGIYPKSTGVINILDYVLLIDKVYSVKKLDLKSHDFFEKKYIKSLKKGLL